MITLPLSTPINQGETKTVTFYGNELITIKVNEVVYTAVRPIVEALGLNWASQSVKLNKNKEKFSCCDIATTGKDGKTYQMLCMPIRKLNGWLFSINPEKVRADLKVKVIQYQEECFEVLYNYWYGEPVTQKPLSGAEYLLQMAQQMVEQERRLALQEQHLATHDIQIKEIQAKQQALTDSSDFFSVLAFANLHNIGLTNGQLSALSRKCGKLSKENGVMIGKISDPRFGRVKTYHRSILVEAFNKAGYV